MVRKYCRHNKSINTTADCRQIDRSTDYYIQWERDEDDTVEKDDDDITKAAAGYEIITIFRVKEVVYLVQVFLHGRYGI